MFIAQAPSRVMKLTCIEVQFVKVSLGESAVLRTSVGYKAYSKMKGESWTPVVCVNLTA